MNTTTNNNNNINLSDQFNELNEWLLQFYSPLPVPLYEQTESTLYILQQLKQYYTNRTDSTTLLIADLTSKSNEYQLESNRISEQLSNSIELSLSDLSTDSKSIITDLATTATELNLKSINNNNYYTAITALNTESNQNTKKLFELTTIQNKLTTSIIGLQSNISELELFINNIELNHNNTINNINLELDKLSYFKLKIKEYSSRINNSNKELNTILNQNNINNSSNIDYSILSNKSAELELFESELIKFQSELSQYSGLPSNLELSKLLIQQSELELLELESELDRGIQQMAFDSQSV